MVETVYLFELLLNGEGIPLSYKDEKKNDYINHEMRQLENDQKYAMHISQLIINDNVDYFSKIFHNICMNREYFLLQPFINYCRWWNTYLILSNITSQISNQTTCVKCRGQMTNINNAENNKPRCIVCGFQSNIKCCNPNTACNVRLWFECAAAIL